MLLQDVALQLNPADPVAIARQDLAAGMRVKPGQDLGESFTIRDDIPAGHKFALRSVNPGETVLRYGQPIGIASQAIAPGEWVHTHNLSVGNLERDFAFRLIAPQPGSDAPSSDSFSGYVRSNGMVGTRNYIAVVSTVSCSSQTARAIAQAFQGDGLKAYPQVDGVVAITHANGCCEPLGSTALTYIQRALGQISRHPNVGGVIYVGLGCEGNQMQALVPPNLDQADAPCLIGPYLMIQACGGIEKTVQAGVEAVQALLPRVNAHQRTPAPLSALRVALQCGGSDGWSGVTANPLVGQISDRIVSAGGTVVLAETPEIYGAEHLLLNRVASEAAGQKLIAILQEWQRQSKLLGFSLDNNPSPGNKKGGITTIYEKSLGAIAKAGTSPLVDAVGYAEWITSQGFVFMDTPGYDPVSVTGEVAGGCNLVLFTTGRGSVFGGNFAPCIKIASNTAMYRRMQSDMDYDAGELLTGKSMDLAAEELLARVIAVASGERSRSERIGFRDVEFAPWHVGATL